MALVWYERRALCTAPWSGALEEKMRDARRDMPGDRPYRPRIRSEPFSPIMMVGALVFELVTIGMIEASITRSPSTPRTRSSGSTTAFSSIPMVHVLVG